MAFQAKTPWRVKFGRAVAAILVALAVSVPTVAPANAIENLRKYAGIVVDAKSGKVLYEEAADSKRYPASVAKVMTLYVLFQELSAGNLKLSTQMTVSKHAASAEPTKLGLRAGATISVEDAIKSLVTLSANDMARVVAENISGSEAKFAQRMTATARALGMRNTTYRNASGLPDGGQTTTVRDQAILGIAVYQHFPSYYEFFQTKSFSYGKKTYGNHNRVLGYMGAVDGIKTGYINAAGSNLLTAARKDNRHIVVVAFGFNSSAARNEKVRQLVSNYLPKSRQGNYLQTAMIPQPGRQGNANVQVAVAETSQPGRRIADAVARLASGAAGCRQQSAAAAGRIPAGPGRCCRRSGPSAHARRSRTAARRTGRQCARSALAGSPAGHAEPGHHRCMAQRQLQAGCPSHGPWPDHSFRATWLPAASPGSDRCAACRPDDLGFDPDRRQ